LIGFVAAVTAATSAARRCPSVSMQRGAGEPLRVVLDVRSYKGDWPDIKFEMTIIVAMKGPRRLCATVTERLGPLDDDAMNKLPFKEVNYADICPPFDPKLYTEAAGHPALPSSERYVKELGVACYNGRASSIVKKIATREANVCEKLARGGRHKNIAEFLGCVVRDGCVAALCFPKYCETLAERLDRGCRRADVADVVDGLRSAVGHLHRMNLSHNDINPGNIMFAGHDDKTPILIDFDSCGEVGTEGFKGCTPGWGDENRAVISRKEHDEDAIGRIEAHLANHDWTSAA